MQFSIELLNISPCALHDPRKLKKIEVVDVVSMLKLPYFRPLLGGC